MRTNHEKLTVRDGAPRRTWSAIGRFLNKILVGPIRMDEYGNELSRCWIWTGCQSRNGYGQFKVDGRRSSTVRRGPHSFAYEYFIGPIPDGHEVHHTCYVRACCNPLHLEAVSHRDNVTDRASATFVARNAHKTHCAHGHELSGANLRQRPGRRACRACNAKRQREFQARRKGIK